MATARVCGTSVPSRAWMIRHSRRIPLSLSAGASGGGMRMAQCSSPRCMSYSSFCEPPESRRWSRGSPLPSGTLSSIQAASRSKSITTRSQVADLVLEVLGELGLGRVALAGDPLGGPHAAGGLVIAQQLAGDGELVHRGGSGGQAHDGG